MTTSENSTRRSLRISGQVQGVGFRWWARGQAKALGLHGTVRNHPNGTVRIDVEGGADAVNHFCERLRSGPPLARVERVDELEPPTGPLPADFQIVS